MIKYFSGDIFDAPINGLCHAVNAHGVFGRGLAKEVKKRFPRAFDVEQFSPLHSKKKLGGFTFAAPDEKQSIYVFNVCSQFNYGTKTQKTEYDALYQGLESLKHFLHKMEFDNFILGIPDHLSCGLGGGNWETVLGIIKYLFEHDEKITVLICKLEK